MNKNSSITKNSSIINKDSSINKISSIIPKVSVPKNLPDIKNILNNNKYAIIISLLILLILILLYYLYKAYNANDDLSKSVFSLYKEIDTGIVKCKKVLTQKDLDPKYSNDFTAMVWIKIDKSTWSDYKIGKVKNNLYYHVFHKGDSFPDSSKSCKCIGEEESVNTNKNCDTNYNSSIQCDKQTKLCNVPILGDNIDVNLTQYDDTTVNSIQVPYVPMTPALFICPDNNDVAFVIDVCENNCDSYYKKAIFIKNVDVNKWIHLAIVNNNNIIEIYMNGELIKNIVLNSPIKSNDIKQICFGEKSRPGSDTGFNGYRANFLYSAKPYTQDAIDKIVKGTKLSNRTNKVDTVTSSISYNYNNFISAISLSNLFKKDEACF